MRRLLIFSLTVSVSVSTASAADIDFNRDIRPILSNKCFACHGPDEHDRKADLRLDTHAGAVEDRKGSIAIVPGNPDKSDMVERMLTTDADDIMPPPESHKKLEKAEIALLTRWIKEGAEYAEPWTYTTPTKHPIPSPKDKRWAANWIDSFVLARLEAESLKPSPPTDPRTLIRRVTFDLTGLPPKPTDVEAFAADPSPAAYEKLVDRLLASPHYGERMAAYWLDLVRFADTVGYHGDQDHRVGPYRDYVIEAFNQNMPFDQFTREQLAGDLLENATLSQKVATCYNRLLQTSHEGGVQTKEYLAIYAADRVRNVSNVWMGATVGCAQCHDHKYDPYTAKDFYAMAAFFADVDEAQHFKVGTNALPTRRPPEIAVGTKDQLAKAAALDAEVKKLEGVAKKAPKDQKRKADQALKAKRGERDKAKKSLRMVMVTQSTKPRTMRILPRGNWLDDSGDIVEPAIPEFMGGLKADGRATRLDFANWLVAEGDSGLLTARVQVNRFWYLLFGTGIAKVLDDFGGQGVPPVQPQLLDNLAVEFVDADWDIKHMMKLLVSSTAYKQSSISTPAMRDKDPYNQLVARQGRYRMPAEMVRDNALSISGLLVDQQGGDSVKPYQPAGYYRHLNFPVRKYSQHSDDRQWRRGVYVHWQRQFLHPMLKAFDAPSREECTAERPRSNTPTAALVLLNDPTFVEAAKMFAARLIKEEKTTDRRLALAAALAWSRPPTSAESATLKALFDAELAVYKKDGKAAAALAGAGLKKLPGDVDVAETAAWTAVARAILCTNEAITRN
jgi:hypothetical protein